MRQETVLLGLVETMDLVDEQQRPAAPATGADFAVSNTLRNSGTPEKIALTWTNAMLGLGRQQPGDGGLSDPRRPPEDQRSTDCPAVSIAPSGPSGRQHLAAARSHRPDAPGADGRPAGVVPLSVLRWEGCRTGRPWAQPTAARCGLKAAGRRGPGLGHPRSASSHDLLVQYQCRLVFNRIRIAWFSDPPISRHGPTCSVW
jgi:hypothetical protein